MRRREFLRWASTGSAALWIGSVYGGAPASGAGHSAGAASKLSRSGAVLTPYSVTDPALVEMGGVWGESLRAGLDRLAKPPFDARFVLADLDFNQKRWFTNYSGDISGRFVEVTSAVSEPDRPWPAPLSDILAKIPDLQKGDGHFGAECDWSSAVDFATPSENALVMPILWGNGRLLLGLTAAWQRFGDARIEAAARRLGDFYLETVIPRFCDPARMEEYQVESSGYAAAYVTCVYEGMEGLIELWKGTGEEKYLAAATRMADFHEAFDVLPVRHSHGSLSQTGALVLLYEETGARRYLDRAVARRRAAIDGGYVNPSGSVLEKFVVTGHNQDEGCSEADWLRLNLRLWHNTRDASCLDSIERLLWNGWLANQWPTGGFGHRYLGVDLTGPFSYQEPLAESLWCCSFHAPLALHKLKSALAVGVKNDDGTDGDKILINFPADFKTPIAGNGLNVVSRILTGASNPLQTELCFDGPAEAAAKLAIRLPEWADGLTVHRVLHGADREEGRPSASNRPERADGRTNPDGGSDRLTGTLSDRYFEVNEPIRSGDRVEVRYQCRPYFEDRRLHRLAAPTSSADLKGVVLRYGPSLLFSAESDGTAPEDLNLAIRDGILTGWEGRLKTFAEMTPTERCHPQTFVFNVRVTVP